ncbi:thioesterase family protein [Fluviibacterium sp. DFM31]|uniref:Thioesterase family protein n=1 Tax=Meridianimarinicoccus marinus TaxID=3231483 RepID=A0ABV3L192_9RHOB
MKPGLQIGARASFSRVIRPEEVVPRLFPDARVMDDMPEVLSSAYMIGLFEWACVEQLAPFYEDGECSLGTAFDLTHCAPTPPGLTVTVDTEVQSIDGNFIWFKVRGHDGHDLIGEGRHLRGLIGKERFEKRVAAKRLEEGA